MKKLSQDEIQAVKQLVRHNKVVVDFFEKWYMDELEALPKAPKDNLARSQGRCQVLQEINKTLHEALKW